MNPSFPKRRTLMSWILASTLAFFALPATAQTVIGGDTIDVSAMLDVQASDKGVLLPRLSTAQRNAMPLPAFGLLVFNTTLQCVEINLGTPDAPVWKCLSTSQGTLDLSALDTAYWNRKLNPGDTLSLSSRIDAKLSGYTESDPVFDTSLAKGITALDTAYWNRNILPPSGNDPGNILYWNGSTWTRLAPGQNGQILQLINGLPAWAGVANLTSDPATAITGTTATLGGNITSDGGSMITARGIVYSTTPNPLIGNSILSMGTGSGSFAATIQGLLPNTIYYVRAFAINSIGTAYGNEVSFTTAVNLPTISTNAITNISNNSAVGGGNVTSDGGSPVTSRGLVYGTSPSPIISNSILTIGSGTGTFSGTISGLDPNTTYYVRAFATNNVGTAYGDEVSFTNLCGAYVASGVWKNFMCHNLGAANTSADPFTPSWEINGGYWQWGRKEMASTGPSGSGAEQANDGAITGWNTTPAPDGSWSDAAKTNNDPCPDGFRLPTRTQWVGLIANNVISLVGNSWIDSTTNYSTGRKVGDSLFLPAAGGRGNAEGFMGGRGYYGNYWSSSEFSFPYAWYFLIVSNDVKTDYNYRTSGISVRCLSDQ